MKKILFISTRNIFLKKFSGDIIGSQKIVKLLKKKHLLDIVSLGKEENLTQKNIFIFKSPNFLLKIFNLLRSILNLEPLQFSLFYSARMKKFINEKANNYDIIFFYHIRASQYLPIKFKGRKIIEMGDLYSKNYKQTFKNLNFFNPLKYIYYLEYILVKKIENKIFYKFDKIILFSKNEIKEVKKIFHKKIIQINVSINKMKNIYSFSKKNNKITFIGNLRYLPNILAVKNFILNILPKLKKKIPGLKIQIIGEVNNLNKILFYFHRDVKFLGEQKNLEKFLKGSLCGLANLEIASGVQGKVLTYMSYGLPVICSKNVAINFNKSVITYSNSFNLIKKIEELKYNKKFGRKFSMKSFKVVSKYKWDKVSKNYLKLVNY